MLNYIPVVGSFVGAVFPALLVLVQFGSFGAFFRVALLGLGAAANRGSAACWSPGSWEAHSTSAHWQSWWPREIWGGVWGITGMLLCVPITVILMIVCAHFESTRPLAILLSASGCPEGELPRPTPADVIGSATPVRNTTRYFAGPAAERPPRPSRDHLTAWGRGLGRWWACAHLRSSQSQAAHRHSLGVVARLPPCGRSILQRSILSDRCAIRIGFPNFGEQSWPTPAECLRPGSTDRSTSR